MFERFMSPASRIATRATSWRRVCATGTRRSCSTPPRSRRASTTRRRLWKLPVRPSCKSCSPDRAAKPGRTRRAGFPNRITPCKWCCPSSMGGCSPRRSPSRPRRARSQVSNSPASRISQRQRASPPLRAAHRCGHASPPRRALSGSLRSCCPTIPEQRGKPPTPWASTPSPAPPRSCGFSKAKASMSAIRFPTTQALSPRFAMPNLSRSSRSPTTSACSRNSMLEPAPRLSPPGARPTTILPSATVISPCASRATAD